MKKYTTILLLSLLFCACSKEDDTPTTEQQQTQVGELIDIQITASQTSTKTSYEPNTDSSIYLFSWELGDQISVIIPDTDNANQKFTTTTAAASTQLDGQIATWSGSNTVYAIYPYSASGYTISSGSLFFDNTTQIIDATAGNSYANGLMVAAADNSTAVAADDYSISELSFAQVMSFLELELTDIPDGERCTTIGLEAGSDLFVLSADIDLSSGAVSTRTYSSSVSAMIENQSGSTASLNFALLPADLSNNTITLYITTISDTDSKKYTYQIDGGINFESNNFLHNGSGTLSLTQDFTESGTGVLYLSNFDDGFIPSEDTWVICDTEATSDSFDGIKTVLSSLYTSGLRRISIELPYLTDIPNSAFSNCSSLSSISAPAALSIGDSSFSYCSNLASADIPLATMVGTFAFKCCYPLAAIELPLVTTIGYDAFNGCSTLTTVELPKVTTIESSTFQSCTALSIIKLPLVTSIGYDAFWGCTTLSTIELPVATTIGSSAFRNCTTLAAIELPKVTTIESSAFYGCDALRTISLATDDDVVLSVMGSDVFRINDASTNEENITLTLGLSNKDNVVGNTLTVTTSIYSYTASDISYTFNQIIILGDTESYMTASGNNGIGVAW